MRKIKKGFVDAMMRHHDIVWLIVILLVSFGIFGLVQMNKQEFPDFTIRQGVVAAVFPGANTRRG